MNTGLTAIHDHRCQAPKTRGKRRCLPAFPHGNWCLLISISTHSSTYFGPACSQYRDVFISVQRFFAPKTGLKTPSKGFKPINHVLIQSTGKPIPTSPFHTATPVTLNRGPTTNIRYFCLLLHIFLGSERIPFASHVSGMRIPTKQAFPEKETIVIDLFLLAKDAVSLLLIMKSTFFHRSCPS